jgi:hypothetical protein
MLCCCLVENAQIAPCENDHFRLNMLRISGMHSQERLQTTIETLGASSDARVQVWESSEGPQECESDRAVTTNFDQVLFWSVGAKTAGMSEPNASTPMLGVLWLT